MSRSSLAWIYLAAAISLMGVVIHLGAIVGGAPWLVFFGAPPFVVESARSGTLLAPLGSLAIALAMGLCAAYALSAAAYIRRLPLLRLGLASIASVCLFRALVLIPLALLHPAMLNTFEVVAAIIWGLAGVGFALGFFVVRARPQS
ncbi:hypothetical protein WG899_05035 [Paucibacter sp. AS339]|uniref:hypothetical protein n=1 Tax=Paucibacter hankyongi TaxID=3133434 RepID=UPI0030AED1BC